MTGSDGYDDFSSTDHSDIHTRCWYRTCDTWGTLASERGRKCDILPVVKSAFQQALITCIRDPCSATSLQQKEFTDIDGNGHFSREVSVATLTALARRSLNIEILRDPAKGKCISSIPRRAEFTFTCSDHFEQLLDADAKKLFWLEIFDYPTAASSLLTLVIPNVHSGTNLLSMIVYPHHD